MGNKINGKGKIIKKNTICEYTKLSEMESSITDVNNLLDILNKWRNGASGKIKIRSRSGHNLSKSVCISKCALIIERINSLKKNTIDKLDELSNIDGIIRIDKNDIIKKFMKIGKKSTKCVKDRYEPDNSNNSLISTIKNKIISGITYVFRKLKDWMSKRTPLMKGLIWIALVILTALALYAFVNSFLIPELTALSDNGFINASFGTFKAICGSKSFMITVKIIENNETDS